MCIIALNDYHFTGFYMVLQSNSKNTKVLLWYMSKLHSITMVSCPKNTFFGIIKPPKAS